MKILWLCNIILPAIAERLNLKASNKEGWLSGICDAVKKSHDFDLAISFPVPKELDGFKEEIEGITYYGFYENTSCPENYDASLEEKLFKIVEEEKPEVVHIFGTEFPHTLAMCKVMRSKNDRVLVGIQGILDVYKDHYFDSLPDYVIRRVTIRDFLRNDSLIKQQKKYALRAINEVEAVKLTGNITGRTPFDLEFSTHVHPEANYYFMNETLRPEFYSGRWDIDTCERHSVFLSQGNYPIKGLHVMLEALNMLKEEYKDIKVYVAGDVITKHSTIKDKIKISSYGKYILELIDKYKLSENVIFTGSLNAEEIKERLLKSNVFVCPSSIENSPNSLGEAMILGVPCVASKVGGVAGIFKEGTDGLMFDNGDAKMLSKSIDAIFTSEDLALSFSEKASMHANITHNPETNYKRLLEIYKQIS